MFQSSALLSSLYNRSVVFGIVPSSNPEQSVSVIYIQFQIHLNHADVMVAEKMAHVFTSNLHQKVDPHLSFPGNWAMNITAIKFAGSKKTLIYSFRLELFVMNFICFVLFQKSYPKFILSIWPHNRKAQVFKHNHNFNI